MPIVRIAGARIECKFGDNLRQVLLRAKLPLYDERAKPFHCRGMGMCGMCAVKIRGSASWPTKTELLRLRLPPHDIDAGLRLACQCNVHGDLVVERFPGIWGQHVKETRADQGPRPDRPIAESFLKSQVKAPVQKTWSQRLLGHSAPKRPTVDHQSALETMILTPQRPRAASRHRPRPRDLKRRRHVSAMSPLARRDQLRLRAQCQTKLRQLRRSM